jgi:hypothetical protein
MTTWRTCLPAAALVVVVVGQVWLVRTAALSPWKGGGFGMFATTDGTASRRVRLFVAGRERSEEIAVPPSLEERASRAGLFPSNPLLTHLAEAVAARERRHGRSVSTVRVEVWGTDFSGEPLRATERRIRSLVLALPGDAP